MLIYILVYICTWQSIGYYKRPPFLCGAGGVVIYKCCDIAASLAACLVSQCCGGVGLAGGVFGVVL